VVGIMSDLSGTSKTVLPKMKDRKFVEIDRDNFTPSWPRSSRGLHLGP